MGPIPHGANRHVKVLKWHGGTRYCHCQHWGMHWGVRPVLDWQRRSTAAGLPLYEPTRTAVCLQPVGWIPRRGVPRVPACGQAPIMHRRQSHHVRCGRMHGTHWLESAASRGRHPRKTMHVHTSRLDGASVTAHGWQTNAGMYCNAQAAARYRRSRSMAVARSCGLRANC